MTLIAGPALLHKLAKTEREYEMNHCPKTQTYWTPNCPECVCEHAKHDMEDIAAGLDARLEPFAWADESGLSLSRDKNDFPPHVAIIPLYAAPVTPKWCSWCKTMTHTDAECWSTRPYVDPVAPSEDAAKYRAKINNQRRELRRLNKYLGPYWAGFRKGLDIEGECRLRGIMNAAFGHEKVHAAEHAAIDATARKGKL